MHSYQKLAFTLGLILFAGRPVASADEQALMQGFQRDVLPTLQGYCLDCHSGEEPEAMLDLSGFESLEDVVSGIGVWKHVVDRVAAGEMPPEDADQPAANVRQAVVDWSRDLRRFEAERHAGDPGPVLAHRLSASEYDYSIRDLTGVDIRPASQFPVDPANEAGFDNTGESLAMTPGLLNKYLDAARMVADHMLLTPDGIAFADHPVVVDTDRDKHCVRRIVKFYEQQPTDLAEYFFAAWKLHELGPYTDLGPALDLVAERQGVSRKYLETVWKLLEGTDHHFGPIATLRSMWQDLAYQQLDEPAARTQSEAMGEFVTTLRLKLRPQYDFLKVRGINNGSQPFVLWRNRQYANTRLTLHQEVLMTAEEMADAIARHEAEEAARANERAEKRQQLEAKMAKELAALDKEMEEAVAAEEKTEYEASVQKLIAKRKWDARLKELEPQPAPEHDQRLVIPPADPQRSQHVAAFEEFCRVFPDTFYVKSRGREYAGLQGGSLANEAKVRLLSAGFHSQMGFFRDDTPLYELVLDEDQRRELDRLWFEFDLIANIPQRQHQGYIWYERGESRFISGPEFDFARPEDKDIASAEKIRRFADTYLDKAEKAGASDEALAAIEEHFSIVNSNIRRTESARVAAEQSQVQGLVRFAERAYRRPLTDEEREEVSRFYNLLRERDGLTHEDAMRDVLVRILMSPHFCFSTQPSYELQPIHPLSQHALASRLSYFLWSTMPDDELLDSASRGELQDPDVLRGHVRRMLNDDRVEGLATEFGGNWLGHRKFQQHTGVDRGRFPQFDDELRQSMYQEPARFFVDLLRRDGSVMEFLDADHTFVDAKLATHYGMDDVTVGEGQWVRVDDASRYQRGGLLPMSVFLTKNAHALRTSPVKRGYWVVRQLLGERIPPPPPEVPELPSDESELGDLTLRQVLAKHREHQSCSGCHDRFDALGVALEAFGPIGERREIDLGGRPVDTTAEMPDGSERTGVPGLRSYLDEQRRQEFVDNLCEKLLSYALGRTLIVSDDLLLEQMRDQLEQSDYRFASLIETIVTSPVFMNQRGHTFR